MPKKPKPCCETSHIDIHGEAYDRPCKDFEASVVNGRCVYCDHTEACHLKTHNPRLPRGGPCEDGITHQIGVPGLRWFTPEAAVVENAELWRDCLTATGHDEPTRDPTYGDETTEVVHDAELAATLFSLHLWRLSQR